MKRIWKELVILCGFASMYCLLLFDHEQHMNDLIIKEIPYVTLLITTIVCLLWIFTVIRKYQQQSKITQKIQSLCNQYDLKMQDLSVTSAPQNCEIMLDQMNQLLKEAQLDMNTYEYRYRLIARITNEVIFEYNLKNHTICDSLNWQAIADGKHFIEDTLKREIVHPDDAEVFKTFFSDDHTVGEVLETTMRLRLNRQSPYRKTQVRGIVLEGLDGKPEKIIGSRIPI